MYQDFTDEATARAWDVDPASNNPTRIEQLDILLTLVEGEHRPGSAILDIGMGSGRVEELVFGRLPDAFVVGVDASEAMLVIAAGRLSGLRDRYEAHLHDLCEIRTLRLPPRAYRVAFSVQTIHNIPDRDKVEVIRWAFDTLEPGGLFLILDRFAVETPGLFSCFRATWERLGRLHGTDLGEGDTHASHLEVVAGRGDLPAGVETTLRWMRDAGFEAACLHLHANRALIAGRKPVCQG
jgi:tRNA (cmo5U34)-methyltransferase